MSIEAMKQALDLLANKYISDKELQAITALRQAIEQAEKQFNPDWDQQAVLVERIRELEAQLYEQAEKQAATIEDNSQDWAKLDGAVAWHLIERHANNWADVGKMMDEYVAAKLAKTEQEPVAYIDHVSGKPKFINGYVVQTDYDIPLYTAPPKSDNELDAIDKSIHEEFERLKTEIKRLKELAEYRLRLLMKMPEQAEKQEPVAWWNGMDGFKRADDVDSVPNWTDYYYIALYTDPTPCKTCEALARTVMMDQTSHDTAPPRNQWVGLTDADWDQLWQDFEDACDEFEVAYQEEAQKKHGEGHYYVSPEDQWEYQKKILRDLIEAKLKENT